MSSPFSQRRMVQTSSEAWKELEPPRARTPRGHCLWVLAVPDAG